MKLVNRRQPLFSLIFFFFAVCVISSAKSEDMVTGDNWVQFLGPKSLNQHKSSDIATEWSENKNITWKTDIPGEGFSSPVIFGTQVWVTTALDKGHIRKAICLDKKSGKVIHDILLLKTDNPIEKHKTNSHASPTPTIDEGHLYVSFGSEGTYCVDTKTGKIIWKNLDIQVDHSRGAGSSIVLYKDSVLFHFDGIDHQFVLALYKDTGKIKWKTARSGDLKKIADDKRKAYSTPFVSKIGKHDRLISLGAHYLYCYDPNNGKEIWQYSFKGFSNASVPRHVNKHIIFSTGFGTASYIAIKEDGSEKAWEYNKSVPKLMTPCAVDDKLYFGYESSFVSCININTGENVWKQRLKGGFYASPLSIGDKLYFFNDSGECYILKPGDSYNELHVNTLDSGCKATPAISGKALYVRTLKALYRIEN